MTRCPPLSALATLALAATLALPLAAQAQQAPPPAGQRTFPEAAQRGTLKIVNGTSAELNGKPIRLAPGLRIFTPQNALVFAHTLAGKSLKVNYVIEASTGMLHTAWILTEAEAKQPRKSSGATVTNIRTGT
ncbi:hypothetical protein [Acidovorax sp. SDU_ACID1]|uniref:hypothetical protein n=1 Tax=Acidovorax sp. SDU_ACID1 TaxID=3136632 RepID=UPI003872C404